MPDPVGEVGHDQVSQRLEFRRIDDRVEQQQAPGPRREMDPEGAMLGVVGEDVDRQADVPNCGVTFYEFDPAQGTKGKLVLRFANFVAPLVEGGAPVTSAPDVPAAPKS